MLHDVVGTNSGGGGVSAVKKGRLEEGEGGKKGAKHQESRTQLQLCNAVVKQEVL